MGGKAVCRGSGVSQDATVSIVFVTEKKLALNIFGRLTIGMLGLQVRISRSIEGLELTEKKVRMVD